MDTSTASPVEPAWGAPSPEAAPWSVRKTLAAVAVALVLAAAGAAVIYAASGRSTGGAPGWGPPGGFDNPFQQSAAVPDALHGTFVVPDGHGGFRTELTQTGTVTAISASSVTARSADGFTQTYGIGADTRQGQKRVTAGETVSIHAVRPER